MWELFPFFLIEKLGMNQALEKRNLYAEIKRKKTSSAPSTTLFYSALESYTSVLSGLELCPSHLQGTNTKFHTNPLIIKEKVKWSILAGKDMNAPITVPFKSEFGRRTMESAGPVLKESEREESCLLFSHSWSLIIKRDH